MIRLSFFLLSVTAFPVLANDDHLWKALTSEAGMVVFMRHAHAADGNSLAWDKSGNCKDERMLTDGGKAHARRIGDAFRSRGIMPTVGSSPMCRSRDTARIAFGDRVITDPRLREIASAAPGQVKEFERAARSVIGNPGKSDPLVFVSHRPNIDLLTMELVGFGDLLVGKANAKGEIEVLGKIKVK